MWRTVHLGHYPVHHISTYLPVRRRTQFDHKGFCLCAVGRGSTTRPWIRPIYDCISAAQEESTFRKWEQHDEWPLFASWEQHIEFIELRENEENLRFIRACRLQPGFPADKDLRTQYEWSKNWIKSRTRELAPKVDEDQNSLGAGFHDDDILTENCVKGV